MAALANLLVALFVLVTPTAGSADVQIIYQAEDLANSRTGGDNWRVTYTVSGWPFTELEGFRIYFPVDAYADVEVAAFPSQWDAIARLPDEVLPDQAFVAQALENTSSPAVFVVNFQWLGRFGLPGSQRYELFGADFETLNPPGTLDTVSQPIPEPQMSLLILAGLVLLAALAMRREKSRSRACHS